MAGRFSVVQLQFTNCNINGTTGNCREGEARDVCPGETGGEQAETISPRLPPISSAVARMAQPFGLFSAPRCLGGAVPQSAVLCDTSASLRLCGAVPPSSPPSKFRNRGNGVFLLT